jgi:hypothetical protein
MHEAPSDHRRWCHQDDDARPLAAGWIAVTILAASVWATSVLLAYPKSAEVDFTEASWSPTQLAEVDATDASLSNGDLLAVCRTSVSKRKLSTCFGMRNRLALRQATTPA